MAWAASLLSGCATLPVIEPTADDVQLQMHRIELHAGVAALRKLPGLRGRIIADVLGTRRLDARFWLASDGSQFHLSCHDGRVLRLVRGHVSATPPGAMVSAAFDLHCWRELLFLPLLLGESRCVARALSPLGDQGTWLQRVMVTFQGVPSRSGDWFELWHLDGVVKRMRYRAGFGAEGARTRDIVFESEHAVAGVNVPDRASFIEDGRTVGHVQVSQVLASPNV